MKKKMIKNTVSFAVIILCIFAVSCKNEKPKGLTDLESGDSGKVTLYNNDSTESVNTSAPDCSDEISSGSEEYAPEEESETTISSPEIEIPEEPLGYVAEEGVYSPSFDTLVVTGGDYKLEYGVMGLKVYYVQKRLGMNIAKWGYYYEPTIAAVSYFQSQNGLEANGEVDLATWLKMGFSEDEWYNLGAYVTPLAITRSSTAEDMRNIIVDTAELYVGTPYIVGASGKPGEGVDCSGLALQCMYAVGIYPDGLDPVQHSTIEEYNSRLMWADPKFKEIPRGDLLPGDLVFYSRPWSRSVCHVAVYIGDDMCIEALSGEVEILPVDKDDDGFVIVGFKTMFCE